MTKAKTSTFTIPDDGNMITNMITTMITIMITIMNTIRIR